MAKAFNFGRLDSGVGQGNHAAVVFVHGFTGDWKETWGRIPEFLTADPKLNGWDLFGFGYESRRRFDLRGLWSADAGLREIAVMLYTKLSSELPPAKYRAVALVAHSMGGLVVQEALTKYPDLLDRTTHLFLFGTPSAGLEKADKVSFAKQQAEDMGTKSTFITNLRTRWTEQKVDGDPRLRFLTIAGELDQFVPPSSSLEPFPLAARRVVPGNHVTMLDVESAGDPSVKVLIEGLTGGAALAGPRNSARVAAEVGEFSGLVTKFWPRGTPLPVGLDDAGAVDLAIALEKVGRSSDAIELLLAHKPQGTDPLGVLGGRLKRRWLVTRLEDDYQSAKSLYEQGYARSTSDGAPNPDQAYYHGINLAFLELAHNSESNYDASTHAAEELAKKVLGYCQLAKNPLQKLWRLATEGDALIILSRWEEGLKKHGEAKTLVQEPWQALSIEDQAVRLAKLLGHSDLEIERLVNIYEGEETGKPAITTGR